jgi:hypothetical protein
MIKYEQSDRTITCTIIKGGLKAIGRAKCSPGDEFDLWYGKRLALTRAKIKYNSKQMVSLHKLIIIFDNEMVRLAKHNDDLWYAEKARAMGKTKWGVK